MGLRLFILPLFLSDGMAFDFRNLMFYGFLGYV
jgi:hypothetical protein